MNRRLRVRGSQLPLINPMSAARAERLYRRLLPFVVVLDDGEGTVELRWWPNAREERPTFEQFVAAYEIEVAVDSQATLVPCETCGDTRVVAVPRCTGGSDHAGYHCGGDICGSDEVPCPDCSGGDDGDR